MNQQAFEAGRAAYRQGDLTEAVAQLSEAKLPGEVSGSVDHLLGNCLMRMGRYVEAATAYGDALRDPSYGNAGALACNRGRALLAAGKPQEAIASLTLATKDEAYASPYKAYIALGNAYLKLGNPRDAGVAFRNAAIDESNPEPAGALRSLGSCFMQLGRPVDAVEAYRTALDFSAPSTSQGPIYADLGMAYVAANRMPEAVDAFAQATADGSYTLGADAQAAYDAAQRAVSVKSSGGPSETDAMLAAAGYGTGPVPKSYDPLDPLGESGEFMPSPEDTGFFSITEEELVAADRRGHKVKRKHSGCRGCFVFLLILALLGFGGYAFWRGFGWPTQEAVAEELFAATTEEDFDAVISSSVTDDTRRQIESLVPPSGRTTVKVTGKDSSVLESRLFATVTLAAGGDQSYQIDMVRDGIGWKVSGLTVDYPAQATDGATFGYEEAEGAAAETGAEASTPEAEASEGETGAAEGTETAETESTETETAETETTETEG